MFLPHILLYCYLGRTLVTTPCTHAMLSLRDASESEVRVAYGELYRHCPEVALSIPSVLPLTQLQGVRISSPFGLREDPISGLLRFHRGVDLASPAAPVVATATGWVHQVGHSPTLGHYVRIDHGNSYETTYGHLLETAVQRGAYVRLGEVLGTVGQSGRSTGFHLHYEVRKSGVAVDPINYLLLWYEQLPPGPDGHVISLNGE